MIFDERNLNPKGILSRKPLVSNLKHGSNELISNSSLNLNQIWSLLVNGVHHHCHQLITEDLENPSYHPRFSLSLNSPSSLKLTIVANTNRKSRLCRLFHHETWFMSHRCCFSPSSKSLSSQELNHHTVILNKFLKKEEENAN